MEDLDEIKLFIENYVSRIKPLLKKVNISYWNAYATGKKEYFQEYEEVYKEIKKLHNNKEDFEQVKQLLKVEIGDDLIKRQVQIIYDDYLMCQGELELINKIVSKEVEIEKRFNEFRAEVGGKKITDNEIKKILKIETDSEKLQEAWEANKKQGELVEKDLLEIIKLRNELARSQGFENYYVMSLESGEQNLEILKDIFDELYELTKIPFGNLKKEIDNLFMKKFGVDKLKPWHYGDLFFQEAPEIYKVDLDKFFDQDILEISKDFYNSTGIEVEDILQRSDLYEKEGKSQHAFCFDLDREGDIRILENIKNNENWMNTTLHELGHAVYDKFIDAKLPFLLRSSAHIFVTEAIAMLFGRQSKNYAFIKKYSKNFEENSELSEKLRKMLRLNELVFARWAQVMFNFERALYENPDQDFNKLWWEFVKKYQLIDFSRNKPDWASKMHFVSAPVYYHNYMLGEMFASQLHNKLTKDVLKEDSLKNVNYSDNEEVGNYLKKNVFAPGASYKWDGLVEKATGEKLTSKYFIEEFG